MNLLHHVHTIEQFKKDASAIIERHKRQTLADVDRLRKKYETPIFGQIKPWTLVEMLAQCIDPTDSALLCASQQIHVLQIIDGMERDGVATTELVLAALLHDLGKVLLVIGEAPENVVCYNDPIETCAPGAGLDNCVFQWNHDEFIYSRLKQYLPDRLAWLLRFHSIVPAQCAAQMDARDRQYLEEVFRTFSRYDHATKSFSALPKLRIGDYRLLVEKALPKYIVF